MIFQLNSDRNIKGDERLAEIAERIVAKELGSLVARLTRTEVYLQDVNAAKGGPDDIRCVIETRPDGMNPSSVTSNGADIESAIRGAAKKLRSLLDSEIGRLGRGPWQRRP